MTDTVDLAYRVVIEARISELLRWRQWYRARPDWAAFMGLAHDHDHELRALLKLAREARAVARKADEHADPVTQAKGMTEGERQIAWGR